MLTEFALKEVKSNEKPNSTCEAGCGGKRARMDQGGRRATGANGGIGNLLSALDGWSNSQWPAPTLKGISKRGREIGLAMQKTDNNPAVGVIEDLYEMSQVAQILRCSHKTIYRLISSGRLGAVRWGRSYRFRRVDLQEFVRSSVISHRRGDGRDTQLTN